MKPLKGKLFFIITLSILTISTLAIACKGSIDAPRILGKPAEPTKPEGMKANSLTTSFNGVDALIPFEPTPWMPKPTRQPTPTVMNVVADELPENLSDSDMLYIVNGHLMIWDNQERIPSTLVDNVEAFSVDALGKRIALLRPRMVTANGVQIYAIELFDFDSRQTTILLEGRGKPESVFISPNGEKVAFSLVDKTNSIYILPTKAEPLPIELGTCTRRAGETCNNITWSPDSSSILWSDDTGIWLSITEKAQTKHIRSSKVEITDPKGNPVSVEVNYSAIQWSPAGRYALTKITPHRSTVTWQAVLDTFTGRLGHIPNTYTYNSPESTVQWLNDGRLAVGQPSDPLNSEPPRVKIWRMLPTNPNLMTLDRVYEVNPDGIPPNLNNDHTIHAICLRWLEQLNQNTLVLGASPTEANVAPLIFSLEMGNGKMRKLWMIPHDAIELLWSPDGRGALIFRENNQIIYASIADYRLYDLSRIFGRNAHSFFWMPIAKRP